MVSPLLAAQPAPALLPGEGVVPRAKSVAWGGTVAVMMVQCFGGGLGNGTKSKYPLHWGGEEFNSRVWGFFHALCHEKNQVRQSPV